MDTELCCPKGKCGCQYFILLTLNNKFKDTGILDFSNRLLFLLKVRSCDFISNFHHNPPPPPKRYTIVSLIINSDFLFKINLIYKTTDICSIFNADLSFSRNKFFFFSLNCWNNIYLTVKFTNKIHPPLFSPFFSCLNQWSTIFQNQTNE